MNPRQYVKDFMLVFVVAIYDVGIPLKCISFSLGMFANAYGEIYVYDVIDVGNVNELSAVPLNKLSPMQFSNLSYDGSLKTTDVNDEHP